MTTVNEEEEEGWDHEMLKLIAASRDTTDSPSKFNDTSRFLIMDYGPALERVNMETIKKV